MYLFMTRTANRNHIKPMFWFIAEVMVVVSGLLATATFVCAGFRQVGFMNSTIYGVLCFFLKFMILSIFLCCSFAFFAMKISILRIYKIICLKIIRQCFLPLFCFSITQYSLLLTAITPRMMPVYIPWTSLKIRQWLRRFAFRALLCYNHLRHGLFSLSERLCLEPDATKFAFGSLHCNIHPADFKEK